MGGTGRWLWLVRGRQGKYLISVLAAMVLVLTACVLALAAPTRAYADVYAYVCVDTDETTNEDVTTLVIKSSQDQWSNAPTTYGTVTRPVQNDEGDGFDSTDAFTRDLSSLTTVANGGVGTSLYQPSWPWYSYYKTLALEVAAEPANQTLRYSIDKVVVESGVSLHSAINLFKDMPNCTEYDLRGLDTTQFTNISNNTYSTLYGTYGYIYGPSYLNAASGMFYGINDNAVIRTGSEWTLPWIDFGFYYSSYLGTTAKSWYSSYGYDEPKTASTTYSRLYKYDSTTQAYVDSGTSIPVYFNAQNGETVEYDPFFEVVLSGNAIGSGYVGRECQRYGLPWGEHTYYVNKDLCEANYDADASNYSDGYDTTLQDTFTFFSQPSDRAGYTTSELGTLSTEAECLLATGLQPKDLSYQWYSSTTIVGASDDITAISGATTYTYTPTTTTAGYTYYYCLASVASRGSSARSNIVKVTVFDPADGPTISDESPNIYEDTPVEYVMSEKPTDLFVTATSSSLTDTYDLSTDPTMSYQWYVSFKGGDFQAIDGATESIYTPDTRGVEAGLYAYKCIITCTVSTYAYPVDTVTLSTESDAFYVQLNTFDAEAGPVQVETISMDDASYTDPLATRAALSVKASVPTGSIGELTYQWYSSADDVVPGVGTDGAMEIPEDDEAVTEEVTVPDDGIISYTPLSSSVGDRYYYCVATNTFESNKISSAVSVLAHITTADTVEVGTAAELQSISQHEESYYNYTIKLTADIDLSVYSSWAGFELHNATFDGQGHTISGVNLNYYHYSSGDRFISYSLSNFSAPQAYDGGLFSFALNSTIKNLKVVCTGSGGVGGVASAALNTTFDSIITSGTIGNANYPCTCGGIVGIGHNVTISNCGNEATILSSRYTSGWHEVTTAFVPYTGGLAGALLGACTVTNSYNKGTVGTPSPSGLIGAINPSQEPLSEDDSYYTYSFTSGSITVSNCYNTGYLDALTPETTTFGNYKGDFGAGLVGLNSNDPLLTMTNCYNAGDLSSNVTSEIQESNLGNFDETGKIGVLYRVSDDEDSQPVAENNYCLAGMNYLYTDGATTETEAEMRSDDLVTALNGTLAESQTGAYKAGTRYPVLAWETLDATVAPEITDQDTTQLTVTQGEDVTPIAITVTVPAREAYVGTLTYQWYENSTSSTEGGTAISEASGTFTDGDTITYTPTTGTPGHAYYYCIVTNTTTAGTTTAVSAVYDVRTLTTEQLTTPVVTVQPASAAYVYGATDDIAPLTFELNISSLVEEGDLTYQWKYSVNGTTWYNASSSVSSADSTGKTATFMPTVTGSYYFKCIITNTLAPSAEQTVETDGTALISLDPIYVSTADELLAISNNVASGMTYSNAIIYLTADVDLSADSDTAAWTPIGNSSTRFAGTFDGQNHTISGMNVSDVDYAGFFGGIAGATVKNLTVEGSVTNSSSQGVSAGIAAYNASSGTLIENCVSKVNIQSTGGYAAGIVGRAYNRVTIEQCANLGDISGVIDNGSQGIGGIFGGTGKSGTTIQDCYNWGNITGDATYSNISGVGGIFGYMSGGAQTIKNCYNAGTVSAPETTVGTNTAKLGAFGGYYNNTNVTNIANNYFLEGSYQVDGADYAGQVSTSDTFPATSESDSMLRSEDMVSALNGEVAEDATPVWQQGSMYPVFTGSTIGVDDIPIIMIQPGPDAAYELGATDVAALSTKAIGADGIEYQWYSSTSSSTEGATELTGVTGESFIPSTVTAGTTYYFCRVTSGGGKSIDTSTVKILVASATAAATPTFTTQPVSASYQTTAEPVALTVAASVSGAGAGDISYQWYQMMGTSPDQSADTALEGATNASYLPSTDGTASYYCVATNTFEVVKTATATSEVAIITCVNEILTISSVEELADFRDSVNEGNDYFGKTIELASGTYDLSTNTRTASWTPIAVSDISYDTFHTDTSRVDFKGIFHGNGATILGADFDSTDSYIGALFGVISGGEIHDLTIEGSLSISGFACGLAVGYIENGVIDNVTVKGTVTSSSGEFRDSVANGTGGIAGAAVDTTISNCTAEVSVSGNTYAGGIVGQAIRADISDCLAEGSVSNTQTNYPGAAGGIAGDIAQGTITRCQSDVDVTFSPYSGTTALYIARSTYTTMGNAAGGIVGVAGTAPTTSSSKDPISGEVVISASKSTGTVKGYVSAGGIVGRALLDTTIDSCYNTGTITYSTAYTSELAGGIVGYLDDTSDAMAVACYDTGDILGSGSANGGIAGSATSSQLVNCYYLRDAIYVAGDAAARSLEQMQSEDFVTSLNVNDANYSLVPEGTPALYWETPHYLIESGVTVAVPDDGYSYTGDEIKPAVAVSFTNLSGTVELVEGTDYTVAYTDNILPGTATVTVTGLGDYAGTVEKSFQIGRGTLTVSVTDATKTVGEVDPEYTIVAAGLVEGDEVQYVSTTRAAGETVGTYAVTPAGGQIVSGKAIVTDYYDVTYVSGTLTIRSADKTTLAQAITSAQEAMDSTAISTDGYDVDPDDEWVTQEVADELADAIAAAQQIVADENATAEQVAAAEQTLTQAQASFEASAESGNKPDAIPVYRLYNQYNGDHLFTTDESEKDVCVANGWTDEGSAWLAPVSGKDDAAVTRLYNQWSGEHLYTADPEEVSTLVTAGWTNEGTSFYSADDDAVGASGIYRLYNQWLTAGTHLFTIDEDEYDTNVSLGWQGEGVFFYGFKAE